LSWDELPSKSDAPRNQRYEMIVDNKLKLFRAVCEQRRARSYEKSDFVLIPQVTCLGYIYVHFSALIALAVSVSLLRRLPFKRARFEAFSFLEDNYFDT